jgi:hypothetical protein
MNLKSLEPLRPAVKQPLPSLGFHVGSQADIGSKRSHRDTQQKIAAQYIALGSKLWKGRRAESARLQDGASSPVR